MAIRRYDQKILLLSMPKGHKKRVQLQLVQILQRQCAKIRPRQHVYEMRQRFGVWRRNECISLCSEKDLILIELSQYISRICT